MPFIYPSFFLHMWFDPSQTTINVHSGFTLKKVRRAGLEHLDKNRQAIISGKYEDIEVSRN